MTLMKYLCVLILSIISTGAVTVFLEAETNSVFEKKTRTNASGNKTLWLHQGDTVDYNFCLLKTTMVTIQDVRTSNDGPSDTLRVLIDEMVMPNNIVTADQSNFGRNWNQFTSSGEIGSAELGAGQHTVSIQVASSDTYGVELDAIEFRLSDEEQNNNIFSCNLQCSFTSPTVTAEPGMVNGKAVQKSIESLCSEITNVKIPVYNTDVQSYEISADLPQFNQPKNLVDGEPEVCPNSPSVYVDIQNVTTSSSIDVAALPGGAQYFVNNVLRGLYIVVTTFALKSRTSGSIDADIGSEITYEIETPEMPATVRMIYSHRNGSSVSASPVEFSQTKTKHSWIVPDFTWKEDGANAIIIHVMSSNRDHTIKSLKVERRNIEPDQVVEIYSTNMAKIDVVKKDFWWLSADRMEVVIPNQDVMTADIANIRVQYKSSLSSDFSEVFSLSQDGHAKLLIPSNETIGNDFKTSVIIGQNNPEDYRPSAPIKRVEIVPEELKMIITYQDLGKSTVTLSPSLMETKATISEMDLKQDQLTTPFATLRSMYVETGNSDSDSITSDQSATERVLGGSWTEISGTTFLLHRRCDSKDVTRSPDLKLKVTNTSSGGA